MMTEAEKLQREMRNYEDRCYTRAKEIVKGAEDGDPWNEKMMLYGIRCAHTLSQPSLVSTAVTQMYRDKHPELKEQRETLQYKKLKEQHQRKMLRTASNPSGDATIARLQNTGGIARRSGKWVWTADRVYKHLVETVGQSYADCWVDTYDKEKRRADENGWDIELHPEGSIIIKKGNNKR